MQHRYCGIRSTLGTPTGQLLHHAISSAFRIHFFDATLICLAYIRGRIGCPSCLASRRFLRGGLFVPPEAYTRPASANVVDGSIEI